MSGAVLCRVCGTLDADCEDGTCTLCAGDSLRGLENLVVALSRNVVRANHLGAWATEFECAGIALALGDIDALHERRDRLRREREIAARQGAQAPLTSAAVTASAMRLDPRACTTDRKGQLREQEKDQGQHAAQEGGAPWL